ncbi:MAG: hypothetical protein R3E79_14285 [Caldilineaceae bacterium]
MANPNGVAVDRSGYIYIAEYGNRCATIAAVTGDLSTIQTVAIFTGTTPSDALARPRIAVDDSDPTAVVVYVTDEGECRTETGRLIKFTFTQGQIEDIRTWSPNGWNNGNGPFICPTGYVCDSYLYVTINYQMSSAFYVYKIDKSGTLCKTTLWYVWVGSWAIYSSLAVAVNSKGEMWVSDTNNSRLQRFKPMETSAPIATIVHLSAASLTPGDTLTAIGGGQDGDASNQITEYLCT